MNKKTNQKMNLCTKCKKTYTIEEVGICIECQAKFFLQSKIVKSWH